MARERAITKPERGELERFDPWDTFREMERMMRNFFVSPFPSLWRESILTPRFTPEVNLKETDKEFILNAVVPGMTKDDINIDVSEDTITISGERKCEEEKPGERYHIRQQSYGSFNVSYSLPSSVKPDQVTATYKNGILEVKMPKTAETKAHKVEIKE